MYKDIFAKAGLNVVYESKQPNFPDDMFEVKAYCL